MALTNELHLLHMMTNGRSIDRHTNPMQELNSSVAPSASNNSSSLARRSPVYVEVVPGTFNQQSIL